MLDSIAKDVRYGVRALAASPAFAAVATVSLSLGIGINTAIFSVVNAVLLRPLPVARPAELLNVYTTSELPESSSSYADYLDIRRSNTVFTDLAGHTLMFANVSRDGRSQLLLGEIVTANYFELLGVKPSLGRVFDTSDDAVEGGNRVAVIGERLWRRQFAADPGAVGRTIRIRGLDYTVIGVMPARFSGMTPGLMAELWVPVSMVDEVEPVGLQESVPSPTGRTRLTRRGQRWLFLIGRLGSGATLGQARANLSVIMERLQREYPQTNHDRRAVVVPAASVRIHPLIDGALLPGAAGLMVAVGLVLLMACVNIANMLLARGSSRTREMAIRLAVGASRGRLVRQLLTESLLLATLGGGIGFLFARWTVSLVTSFQPPFPIPISLDLSLDAHVLLFTAAVSVITGAAFGLAPALQATTPDLSSSLKNDPASAPPGRRVGLRDLLVVAQVTVSVVLLVAAGLLVRGARAAGAIDIGFQPEGLAVATFDLRMHRYPADRGRAFFAQALERVRGLPGVSSAALVERLPFSPNVNTNNIFIDGRMYPDGDNGEVIDTTHVSRDYFHTLGIPVLDGRDFDTRDTPSSAGTVIVNQAMARRYWPAENPIGRRLRTEGPRGPSFEVVGVVRDYKVRTVGESPRPIVHFARSQSYAPYGTVVARGSGDDAQLAQAMRAELTAIEPDLIFFENQPMRSEIATTLFPARAGGALAAAFGALALALAAIGLYGVIAFSVSRRTREIGIRMALGANPLVVVALILRQGMTLVLAGLVCGVITAALVTRILAGALYGVPQLDPLAYGSAAGLLLVVAALANLVPARRAARVDPMTALRTT